MKTNCTASISILMSFPNGAIAASLSEKEEAAVALFIVAAAIIGGNLLLWLSRRAEGTREHFSSHIMSPHFDWYVEHYWSSRDPLGPERLLYEKKSYGEDFGSACTRLFDKLNHYHLKGDKARSEDTYNEIVEIFKEYNNPFFNDKSEHLANGLALIFNPEHMNAPELAERLALDSTGFRSVSTDFAIRKMKARNAESALRKWKKQIREKIRDL
jgi:hypothetical protein